MLSVPFKAIGKAGFDLNKNLVVENGTAGGDESVSDTILVWYFNEKGIGGYETFFLYEGYDEDWPRGWYGVAGDKFETLHPDGLPAGTAFWYLAKDTTKNSKVTFSGEVDLADSLSFTLKRGSYNLIANPYPKAYDLNKDMEVTGGTAGGDESVSDTILVWYFNEKGIGSYETFFLYEGYDEDWPRGWYGVAGDKFETLHPDGLPIGTGFWYLAKSGEGELKVKFTK